ncbi:MAG: hypothetical protein CME26_08530 [Gemmatimonadetes bacterium]|nr:hypothetical protein [Gemmatimonadota bacterium]|tara:strand:+ start:2420 stop:3196 length:777 start_codon:yes stop_codon:yes gene_type:complete
MPDRPNILFIFDDQHRHDYLGAAGASWLNTPNLDRLAARGTRFTQTTTNCPACGLSRMALATGLQPVRAGVLNNGFGRAPHGLPTIYQRMRDYGYHVASTGKLHLGPTGPPGPNGDPPGAYALGFTHPCEVEGKMSAGHVSGPTGPYTHYLAEKGLLDGFLKDYAKRIENEWARSNWDSVLPAEDFQDAFIGQKAIDWMRDTPASQPWMMFVNFVWSPQSFRSPEGVCRQVSKRDGPGCRSDPDGRETGLDPGARPRS